MRAALLVMVVAGVSLVVPAASATKAPGPLVLVIRGLDRATARGELSRDRATAYRRLAAHAVAEAPKLPPLRAANLRGVLRDVAAQWRGYTKPRALALFSMLRVNEHELAVRRLPPSGTDVFGPDGVVYRFVPDHGFAFHPLANFARLNALVAAGDDASAAELAAALVARAVRAGRGKAWEYPFPFGRGKPPWTSGMAQAVGAQALARTGDLLSDPSLLGAAGAAYRAIPGRLVTELAAGPWIELYSFDQLAVLNAQLQAVLSLGDYAEITGNADAAALAGKLQATAQTLLPRFDTGFWSLYALDGRESPLSYHDYVVDLLRRLSGRTGQARFGEVADRFEAYEEQPPVLTPRGELSTIYPVPADGHLDSASFRFWLSKPARVTLRVGGSARVVTLAGGSHVLTWTPGESLPGLYRPRLVAVDANGNRSAAALAPVRVRYDLRPPRLSVTVKLPATVSWHAVEPGTPWLELTVRLIGGGERREVSLGRRGLAGSTRLLLPPGRWHVTLVAANSAGKRTQRSLGYLPR